MSKGDKNRTKDVKTYNDNYDLINFSKPSDDNTTKKIEVQEDKPVKPPDAIDNWNNEGGAL